MRVIIFCPEPPYAGAESIVTLKLMRAMLDAGWSADMICHGNDHDVAAHQDVLEISGHAVAVRGISSSFWRSVCTRLAGKTNAARLDSLLWCLKAARLAKRLHRKQPYDLMISRIMPQYGHLPALLLSRRVRIPWIANWSDPFPVRNAPEPYGCGNDAPLPWLTRHYLSLMARVVSAHTMPSDRLREYYWRYWPQVKAGSYVLPHVIRPRQNTKNPAAHDRLLLTHIGGLGLRSPAKLLTALAGVLRQRGPLPVFFRFVGTKDPEVEELIDRLSLSEYVELTGFVAYQKADELIEESDLMLIIEAECQEGIFLPSKLMNYLEADKPVWAISPRTGIMSDLLNTYGGGICSDCTSVPQLENSLGQILNDWHDGKLRQKQYQVHDLKALFLPETVLSQLDQILEKAIKK